MPKAMHIPGPWQQCPLDSLRIEREGRCLSGETAIALVFAPDHRPDRRAEVVPTARLIAAAPELLTALQELVAISESEGDEWYGSGRLVDALEDARHAIAKATREQCRAAEAEG